MRKKYGADPERLQRAVMELHAKEKVSPLAGCLPSLLQLPAFLLMYQLFAGGDLGGHTLFAAPLGGRWVDALGAGGVFGAAGVVYLGLFVVVTCVAAYSYRRTKWEMGGVSVGDDVPGMGGLVKVMPLLSFGTLITVAVVPLAAALYVVTSTTWSAVERAVLYRRVATAE